MNGEVEGERSKRSKRADGPSGRERLDWIGVWPDNVWMGSTPSTGAKVLSQRALNRALLARQMLLQRESVPVSNVVERLGGLQAQAPTAPYVGLWTRIEGFRPDDLTQLINENQVLRTTMMRATLHLVTARDFLELHPVILPAIDRMMRGAYGRELAGVDMIAVAAATRRAAEEQPRTLAEFGAILQERWPDCGVAALATAARYAEPLVQMPPTGTWGYSGPRKYATARALLGRGTAREWSPEPLVRRYLGAFGPAEPRDMQEWCGLTRLREVFERMRPELAVFRDEEGRELFDLPEAPRPDPSTPAPPRLLSEFDNILLSHVDHGRIITPERRKRVISVNGLVLGTILVDGFVVGTWRIARERGAAVLTFTAFEPIADQDRILLAEEGERLLAFTDSEASHAVAVADDGATD